jgi:predicted nucleic acid-binding protein
MPDRVVLDATAVAAVLFGGDGSEDVLRRTENAELVAPRLLPYELANVAWKSASRAPEQRKAILQALELLGGLDVSILEVDPVEAAGLAFDLRITAYDATYVWLSRHLQQGILEEDLPLGDAGAV